MYHDVPDFYKTRLAMLLVLLLLLYVACIWGVIKVKRSQLATWPSHLVAFGNWANDKCHHRIPLSCLMADICPLDHFLAVQTLRGIRFCFASTDYFWLNCREIAYNLSTKCNFGKLTIFGNN